MNALTGQIREASLADIDFILRLGRKMYPGEPIHNGLPWVIECMRRPDRLVLVSDYGVGIASIFFAYGFIKRVNMDVLAVESGHGLHVLGFLRAMVRWGQFQKASSLRVGSTTGVDFGPAVKRLGGNAAKASSYQIPL
jgi:hypothetical protein